MKNLEVRRSVVKMYLWFQEFWGQSAKSSKMNTPTSHFRTTFGMAALRNDTTRRDRGRTIWLLGLLLSCALPLNSSTISV